MSKPKVGGAWITVTEDPHVCPKPGGGLFGVQPKPLGSVWQCGECGARWRVDYDSNYAGNGWEWTRITEEGSERGG